MTTTVTKLPQDGRVVNHDGVSLKLYYPEPCPLTGWLVVLVILFRRRRWCGPPYDSLKLVSGSLLGASGLSLVYLGSAGCSWAPLGSPGISCALMGWGVVPQPPAASSQQASSPNPRNDPLGSPGVPWALLGAPGVSRALLNPPGLSWALLGSLGFICMLLAASRQASSSNPEPLWLISWMVAA